MYNRFKNKLFPKVKAQAVTHAKELEENEESHEEVKKKKNKKEKIGFRDRKVSIIYSFCCHIQQLKCYMIDN